MAAGVKAWQIFGEVGLTGLGTATSQLAAFDAAGRKAASSMFGVKGASLVAAGAIAAVGLAGVAMSVQSVRAWAAFEDKMVTALAVMEDVSDVMRNDMERAARDVGATTRFSAAQAGEAFYFLASAGLNAAQSLEALPLVASFATAGNFDLAVATDLLADSQSALGLRSADAAENLENMRRVADALTQANIQANASVEQFAEALTTKAGTRLRQVNKDVEEGVAILSVFADQGVKGALAGERLNIVLRDLPLAAVQNEEAFKALNIEVFDGMGMMRNMADIALDFENALGHLSTEQQTAAYNQLGLNMRVQDGLSLLFGVSERLREYETRVREAGGITEDVANKQMQSLAAQWDLMKGKLQDLTLTWGEAQSGPLTGYVRLLNWTLDMLRGMRDAAEDAATGIREFWSAWGPPRWAQGVAGGLFDMPDRPSVPEGGYDESAGGVMPMNQYLRQQEEDANSVRAQARAELLAEEREWARQRLEIEVDLGIRRKEELLDVLRTELDALDEHSTAWREKQEQIMRLEAQIDADRRLAAEEEAERRKVAAEEAARLDEAWLAYRMRIGEISTQERLAQIEIELQAAKDGSAEQLDLLREEHELRTRLNDDAKRLEDGWLQYRIETGELARMARVEQLNAEIAAAVAGSDAQLNAMRERNGHVEQMTADQITLAGRIADENKEAAVETLNAWLETLRTLNVLTPQIEADIAGAIETVSGSTLDFTWGSLGDDAKRAGLQIGQSLTMGIIQGSDDMKEMLVNTLVAILVDLTFKAIAASLGIASPSKVTTEMGRDLMRGLVVGFQGEAGFAASAMSHTAGGLIGAISGGLKPAFPGMGLGGGVPTPSAGGFAGGLRLKVDTGALPRPLTPFEVARDRQWQALFGGSIVQWESDGGRLRKDRSFG